VADVRQARSGISPVAVRLLPMSTDPQSSGEPARLQALHACRVLDTPLELEFDDVARLAALTCGAPIALVSFVDADRQWFKAKVGLAASETPRRFAFCAHAIADDRLFLVPDASCDERFADNPLVTGDPHIRFYAGVPIVTEDGHRLGTVCVIDTRPRQLGEDQCIALRALAGQVAKLLQLRRASAALARTSEELATAKLRLELVVQASCDGIFEVELAPQRVVLSARAWELLSLPVSEGAVPLSSVLSHCHGEDLRVLLHGAVRHLRRHEPFDVEFRLLGGDGLHRWFRARGVAVRAADGRAGRLIGALIDVHDRRLASDTMMRLSELLEESQQQAEVGGWEFEVDTQTLSWTRETYRIHDLAPFSRVPTVAEAIAFYTPEARPVIQAAVEAAIRDGSAYSHELELVTAKGRRIWVRATGRAVREGGRTVRIHGAFQDITARKLAAAELLRAKEAAESASRAKSTFLAAMSHEIRTPVHAVLGYAEMLRESPLSAELREYAEVISRSGAALLRLIDDILDFSKVEAGKLSLERAPVDLTLVARDVERLLQGKAAEKGVRLHLVAPGGPTIVAADPARVRQVMLNLVGNALKFTAEGEVKVGVGHYGQDHWRVEIVDTGIGIPADQQARLFREFEQVDGSSKRRFGGTGLGLAISRRLVMAMGGRIGMCSEPGEGSTFWFSLPETTQALQAQPNAREVVADAGKSRQLPAGTRVLVAEDNVVNQRLVGALFRNAGVEVDIVADGQQAIAMCERHRYAVVFMDCLMPGVDGFEATRAIRSREPHGQHLPIVALTANALPEDRDACLAAGMDDFVSKPFDKRSLLGALQRWVQRDDAP
jgi:signal transduction histidine kinase/CheY-like chemotaxis protein